SVPGGVMPRRPRASHCWDDRGSATAETAIVLPVVVVMVLVVLLPGAGIGSQVRLENAARAAAREMARGEEQSAAVATAQRDGGAGTAARGTSAVTAPGCRSRGRARGVPAPGCWPGRAGS